MMSLACDFTRNVLQDADYDEFCILYEKYDDSLHKMAMKGQGEQFTNNILICIKLRRFSCVVC